MHGPLWVGYAALPPDDVKPNGATRTVGDRLWETIKPSGFASERFKLHIFPTFVRDLDMERLDDVNWFLQLVFLAIPSKDQPKVIRWFNLMV